jgi:hypothetical protein
MEVNRYNEYIINTLIKHSHNKNYVNINNIINIIYNNNIDYIYEYVAYYNNFEICYNIMYGSKSDSFKTTFSSRVIEVWINNYNNSNSKELELELLEQCKYFISFIPNDKITLIIERSVNNNVAILNNVCKLFDKSRILEIKNNLFFNDIKCLEYMVNNYGHYDKNTIKKTLIKMGTIYYSTNEDVIKWIVNNYENYIKDNINNIIINIINVSDYNNIKMTNFIIKYLIMNVDISNKSKFTIFKNSIYYNHLSTFELCLNNIFKYDDHMLFELICLYSNPNNDINNTLLIHYINNTLLEDYINTNLYNKLLLKGINNIVQWIDKYFNKEFKLITDIFFIKNMININKSLMHNINYECMICYEIKNKMITLNCHSTHNICESCIKIWHSSNNSCPMCRTEINFNKCSLHIH